MVSPSVVLQATVVFRGDVLRAGPHLGGGCANDTQVARNQRHQLDSVDTYVVAPLVTAGYAVACVALLYECALNVLVDEHWRRAGRSCAVKDVPRGTSQRTLLRRALATAAAASPSALYVVSRLDITYGAPIAPRADWRGAVAVPWLPAEPSRGKAPDQVHVFGEAIVDVVLDVLARYDSNETGKCLESSPSFSPSGRPTFHGSCDCAQRLFLGPLRAAGVALAAIYPGAANAGACDKRRGAPGPFADCGRCSASHCLDNSTASCLAHARSPTRARCPTRAGSQG